MLTVKAFQNNDFQENTILVYNKNFAGIVFDPGQYYAHEKTEFLGFIATHNIKLVKLINTHCHLDHVFGNQFIHDEFGLFPEYHEKEQVVLDSCVMVADMYGLRFTKSPNAENYLDEKDKVMLGDEEFELLFTPGHSPGSLSFYNAANSLLISGDVLFNGSIGRTDLPGGDYSTLEKSIREKIYALPDDVTVYPGHGPTTTVGHEKSTNPFFRVEI